MNFHYYVSSTGPITSIQSAINQIAVDLSSNPVINQDVVIKIDRGTYAPFKIPDASLSPLYNSGYKLKIESAGNFFPVIDWNRSTTSDAAGIDISSGNPEVELTRLWIQYAPVGIRASTNSHNIKINKCVVLNNRNVGILIEQCRSAQVINSVIVNGDYGLVFKACKNAAAVHNTIFMPGTITNQGRSIAGIWAQTGPDFGRGISDTGKIWLVANCVWNMTGEALSVSDLDVDNQALRSNYNNFFTGSESLITIYSKAFTSGNAILRRTISSLQDWKQLGSGLYFDVNSISADPKFITAVGLSQNKSLYGIDLKLLKVSPLIGVVPPFYTDTQATSAWLPSFVDSSDFFSDILSLTRSSSLATIGSNETVSTSGFFGQDVFSSPLDIQNYKDCKTNLLEDLISIKLDSVYPTFSPGYFYKNDRQYYLYCKKQGVYLGNLAITSFELPSYVDPKKPIVLKVKGKEYTALDYLDIVGTNLELHHKDLPIGSYYDEIDLELYSVIWENGSFQSQKTILVYKILDGKTRFVLPHSYKSHAPVSITNDLSSHADPMEYSNQEFRVDRINNENQIVFQYNSNTIENSKFDYWISGRPQLFQTSGSSQISGTVDAPSVVGDYYLSLTSGYIQTRQPCTTGASVFSVYSKGAELTYSFDFYNSIDNALRYTLTGSIPASESWTRNWIRFNYTGDDLDYLIESGSYPLNHVANLYTPQEETSIDIKLTSTGQVYLDAMQYEIENLPSIYHDMPNLATTTVEFETQTGSFVDYARPLLSTRTSNTDGFLHISELSARVFNGPNSAVVTTLHDWRWPLGRFNVMPWARLKGKDKKVQVYRPFGPIPVERNLSVYPIFNVPKVQDINISPSDPIIRQGDTSGIGIIISAVSDLGNPMYYSRVQATVRDINQRFPGWLSLKSFGLKHQLGQTIVSSLDEGGLITFTYLPPLEQAGTWVGNIPTPSLDPDNNLVSFIKTRYPVNLAFNGNITILDSSGQYLSLEGQDYITQTYLSTKAEAKQSVFSLGYPIVPGSVIITDSILYTEATSNETIESDQYFVDYENGLIYFKGKKESVVISYLPRYYKVDLRDPYKIIFYHDKIFTGITGTITVDYDYTIELQISIENPGYDTVFTRFFNIICRNRFSKEASPSIDYKGYL